MRYYWTGDDVEDGTINLDVGKSIRIVGIGIRETDYIVRADEEPSESDVVSAGVDLIVESRSWCANTCFDIGAAEGASTH